jgi:hypothetical protein
LRELTSYLQIDIVANFPQDFPKTIGTPYIGKNRVLAELGWCKMPDKEHDTVPDFHLLLKRFFICRG